MKEIETLSHSSQQDFYSPRSNRNTKRLGAGENTYRSQLAEIEKPPTPYEDRIIPTLRNNNKTQRTDRSQDPQLGAELGSNQRCIFSEYLYLISIFK